jgi:hypothetical protein
MRGSMSMPTSPGETAHFDTGHIKALKFQQDVCFFSG